MPAAASHEEERVLRDAHERIDELEASIAGRARPAPRSPWHIPARVGFVLALVLIACAIGGAVVPRREVVAQGPWPSPPEIPAGALTWRPGLIFRERGVSLLDVDGDGARDIVGLAWRHGQDALPLHVVVIDRKTYAVRWRAGPFPAAWRDAAVRLEILSGRIVVSDGAGMSHVLDPRSGEEIATPFPAETDWHEESRGPCPADETLPCTTRSPRALEEKLGAIFHTSVFASDYVGDGDRITVASVSGPRGHAARHALRWDESTKRVLWNVPLVPPPRTDKHVNVSPNEWTAIAHGRFFNLYQPVAGEYRIAGRDAQTGALLYDAAVPPLQDGSVIGAVTAEGDDVLIVANESLIVIDGKTGIVTHRLARF
jgi:hypothetical protein